ncbi:MAG: hypothetical protein QM503_10595 [Bacteroidota bacterium]
MGNYHTGYYPGMTSKQVAGQDKLRQKESDAKNHKQWMQCIAYEINNEAKFRANNKNYHTPVERGVITIKEYDELKKST